MFKLGKRQGEGTMTYASGDVQTGAWQDGVLQQAAVPAPDATNTGETVTDETTPAATE